MDSLKLNLTLVLLRYYKQQGYKTIVMGASFRTISEIEELAGIDFLTISTGLLEDLKNGSQNVPKKLDVDAAKQEEAIPKVSFINDEPSFRWELLEEQMAFDKLHEGIKKVSWSSPFQVTETDRHLTCLVR